MREALHDGQEGLRFVESVTGAGYRFVAPLSRLHNLRGAAEGTMVAPEHLGELQQLPEENARLPRVVADLSLEKKALEERAGARGERAGALRAACLAAEAE